LRSSVVRYGPAGLAVVSGVVCAVINPVGKIEDWSNAASIGTGLSFGIALAICEALWGRRPGYLAVLVPVATLIGWIAAWWATLWVGSWADDLLKWILAGKAGEIPVQMVAGFAGGAVGALPTAVSLSSLRRWRRLLRATAIGAVLGMLLALELQAGLPVLYVCWQVGFALYFGRCMAEDRETIAVG
jgi:hypothetical protein